MRILLVFGLIGGLLLPFPLSAQTKKPGFVPPLGTTQKKVEDPESESATLGGKTLDQWIPDISSKDSSRAENAIRTIVLFGPILGERAVPHIIKELNKHRGSTHVDTSVRVNGTMALGQILGSHPNPNKKYIAAAVVVLNRMLRDNQTLVKYKACQSLAMLGSDAYPSVDSLIKALKDPATWETRQAAALALGSICYREKKGPEVRVINALYGSLVADHCSQVRLAAIQSLSRLGAPANPKDRNTVIQAMARVAMRDSEPTVRIWAHMAVMNIQGKIETERLNIIGRVLVTHEDMLVRQEAARALWAFGVEAKGQVPNLVAALKDEEKTVVAWSMMALAKMGSWVKPAIPQLAKISKSTDWPPNLRQTAQGVIAAIEGKSNKDMKKK